MAEDEKFEVDWAQTDEKTVTHILAEGQQFLSAQLTLAISADQRAAPLAGVFATAAAGAAGGGFAAVSSPAYTILGWAAFTTAISFAVASFF